MIWKRYLGKEFAKVWLLVMGAFYLLYALVDSSMHTKVFHQGEVRFFEIACYYFCQCAKSADIFIPVTVLVAVIKILTTMNLSNELTALLSAGISLRKLLRPFWFFASLSVLLLYLNFQWIAPFAEHYITTFEKVVFHKQAQEPAVKRMVLPDDSLLIYQVYEPDTQRFYDLFWYCHRDLIYRMKFLTIAEEIPIGEEVEVIQRIEGQLRKVASFHTHPFSELSIDRELLTSASPLSSIGSRLFPTLHLLQYRHALSGEDPHLYPLSLLWSRIYEKVHAHQAIPADFLTLLCYKMMIPLVCLLAVCAPAPFCLRFGRHLPLFWIYAFSLFSMIIFFTLINACVILGEGRMLSPLFSMVLPILGLLGYFGKRYAKL